MLWLQTKEGRLNILLGKRDFKWMKKRNNRRKEMEARK